LADAVCSAAANLSRPKLTKSAARKSPKPLVAPKKHTGPEPMPPSTAAISITSPKPLPAKDAKAFVATHSGSVPMPSNTAATLIMSPKPLSMKDATAFDTALVPDAGQIGARAKLADAVCSAAVNTSRPKPTKNASPRSSKQLLAANITSGLMPMPSGNAAMSTIPHKSLPTKSAHALAATNIGAEPTPLNIAELQISTHEPLSTESANTFIVPSANPGILPMTPNSAPAPSTLGKTQSRMSAAPRSHKSRRQQTAPGLWPMPSKSAPAIISLHKPSPMKDDAPHSSESSAPLPLSDIQSKHDHGAAALATLRQPLPSRNAAPTSPKSYPHHYTNYIDSAQPPPQPDTINRHDGHRFASTASSSNSPRRNAEAGTIPESTGFQHAEEEAGKAVLAGATAAVEAHREISGTPTQAHNASTTGRMSITPAPEYSASNPASSDVGTSAKPRTSPSADSPNRQIGLIYADDVVILSKSVEEHITHVDQAQMILDSANIADVSLNCKFEKDEIAQVDQNPTSKGGDGARTEPMAGSQHSSPSPDPEPRREDQETEMPLPEPPADENDAEDTPEHPESHSHNSDSDPENSVPSLSSDEESSSSSDDEPAEPLLPDPTGRIGPFAREKGPAHPSVDAELARTTSDGIYAHATNYRTYRLRRRAGPATVSIQDIKRNNEYFRGRLDGKKFNGKDPISIINFLTVLSNAADDGGLTEIEAHRSLLYFLECSARSRYVTASQEQRGHSRIVSGWPTACAYLLKRYVNDEDIKLDSDRTRTRKNTTNASLTCTPASDTPSIATNSS